MSIEEQSAHRQQNPSKPIRPAHEQTISRITGTDIKRETGEKREQ
jgi:hypothetical protein